MQPEVRGVQVVILIHAAYSRSSHACHRIIPPLSTGSRSSFRSRLVCMIKIMMLFDRNTNKSFNKDITKYLDKYHNKSINKYTAKLINVHENSASTSTKPSTSRSTSFNPYLRRSPGITPMPSSHCPNTASTPPHSAPTQLRPALTPPSRPHHSARMPPSRSSHATPTPLSLFAVHNAPTPVWGISLRKSRTRPSVFLYFREIRKKRSH